MRLIDADVLIEVLQNREIHAENVDKRTAIKGDRQAVINAPTIPIRATAILLPPHGKWKDINGDGQAWKCSVCGEVLCCNDNYCPNCGAKMDRGGDAE